MQAQRETETQLFDMPSYSLVVLVSALLENVSPSQQALAANKGGRHHIIMYTSQRQEVWRRLKQKYSMQNPLKLKHFYFVELLSPGWKLGWISELMAQKQ